MSQVKSISARELKAALKDGGEIALLDAREEAVFGERHHLMATCVPLTRLELMVDDLVPRRSARVVWCDDGEGVAQRAAARMAALGYGDVAALEGGLSAWEAEDFKLYSGIHVPSKAFAEVVEHDARTPYISVQQLQAMLDEKANIVIYDSRSFEEYHNNSIPSATSVPGAELVYRFADLAPPSDALVVVNCGGRTRSIIGAQSLISAGVPNRVVSLKDGTMAWHLAGYEVVNGATRRPPDVSPQGLANAQAGAAKVAARCGIATIDRATLAAWRAQAEQRSLYLLDVRTPAEYEAGHLRGARSAPGGQLVQETDYHLATWGARVVLVDDNGVRATMTASWLKQMGWQDVAVLVATAADGDWVYGPQRPRVLGLEASAAAAVGLDALRAKLAANEAVVVDLDLSKQYAKGHIPGAWHAVRARLAANLSKLPAAPTIVLTSADGALASLAAAELRSVAKVPVLALAGGTRNWIDSGLPVETGSERMLEKPDDVYLMPRERGLDAEAAMREYLTWEINLINDMATDDDQRFKLVI
jgi:rhodanese-related sulfurtransferase